MSRAVAVISLLHEDAARSSATREFRGRPVLDWTLTRLARARELAGVKLLCWEDQAEAVRAIARRDWADVLARPRVAAPHLDALAAALRWSDGWRGGLLGACHFDEGFDGKAIRGALATDSAERILLLQPSAGLVDPDLVDALVEHAREHSELDLLFTQAAPGLAPIVISSGLLHRLADADAHPGRLLNYSPDTPGRDPITSQACLAVAHRVARTLDRFTLDSERHIARIQAATVSLNGRLIAAGAEELVELANSAKWDPWPREITLELTPRRSTRPIYSPATHLTVDRGDMPLETAKAILDQVAGIEDLRVTLGGMGDPVLHPQLREIVEYARSLGIRALHLETDLFEAPPPGVLEWLATSPLDVLTVHLPAMIPATYQRVMGVDGFVRVIENLKIVLRSRKSRLPIVAPTFTKCRQNLEEMEGWYDQWLRALGAAAIVGPSDCAGQIPDVASADMAGPSRKPCRRLRSRMTILSDGGVVGCDEDVLGNSVFGRAPAENLLQIWGKKLAHLREAHERGDFAAHPLCGRCREWHRP
jgi:hypothetical protein